MNLAKTAVAAATAIGFCGAPLYAADGILIAQTITSGGKTATHQTQIEKTRMRSETNQNGRKMIIIFDDAAGVLRTVDEQNKTYTEMTKADVERLSAQMSGAMAQMQQQLQNLPPEQRARLEAMMQSGRGMVGAMAGPPTEYRKVGTDTVGRWRCDKYEGTKNGEKSSEMCTVEPSAFGFAASDFEVTKHMAEFFAKMMPQGVEGLFRIGSSGAAGFSGIPVRVVSFRGGQQQSVIEMTEASRQNFPDALFAVPDGYKKREFPGAGRGRQ
jgi:hypothetical protein